MGPSTSPVFIGLSNSSTPVLMPGSKFSNRTYGLDDGTRKFQVHPLASKTIWPQVGNPDGTANPSMYIVDVVPNYDASTLIELDIAYKGIAGKKPDRITPDTDIQMITLPGSTTSGAVKANVIVPVPQPKVARDYVSLTEPTNAGVGLPIVPDTAPWLPALSAWELAFYPDNSKPETVNYWGNQWVLQSRTWEAIVPGQVWFVRERAAYYYALSST